MQFSDFVKTLARFYQKKREPFVIDLIKYSLSVTDHDIDQIVTEATVEGWIKGESSTYISIFNVFNHHAGRTEFMFDRERCLDYLSSLKIKVRKSWKTIQLAFKKLRDFGCINVETENEELFFRSIVAEWKLIVSERRQTTAPIRTLPEDITFIYPNGRDFPKANVMMASQNLSRIRLLAFSGNYFIKSFATQIKEGLARGLGIQVLLSEVDSPVLGDINELEGKSLEATASESVLSEEILSSMCSSMRMKGSLEVRRYRTHIRNPMFILTHNDEDGEEHDCAWLTISLPPISSTDCYTVEFDDNKGTEKCIDHFDAIWKVSKLAMRCGPS
jgi:hypothetical protein